MGFLGWLEARLGRPSTSVPVDYSTPEPPEHSDPQRVEVEQLRAEKGRLHREAEEKRSTAQEFSEHGWAQKAGELERRIKALENNQRRIDERLRTLAGDEAAFDVMRGDF